MRNKLMAMAVAAALLGTALAGEATASAAAAAGDPPAAHAAGKKKKKRCAKKRKHRPRKCAKKRAPARPQPLAPGRPSIPPPPPEPRSEPSPEGYVTGGAAEAEATRRLSGARFISCGQIICGTPDMFERRLDLCSDGRLIYQQYSGREQLGGRWYLSSARLSPGHVEARLTVQTDDLLTTTVDFLYVDPDLVRIDGEEVKAGQSELCG
jgi:hypothetical protein